MMITLSNYNFHRLIMEDESKITKSICYNKQTNTLEYSEEDDLHIVIVTMEQLKNMSKYFNTHSKALFLKESNALDYFNSQVQHLVDNFVDNFENNTNRDMLLELKKYPHKYITAHTTNPLTDDVFKITYLPKPKGSHFTEPHFILWYDDISSAPQYLKFQEGFNRTYNNGFQKVVSMNFLLKYLSLHTTFTLENKPLLKVINEDFKKDIDSAFKYAEIYFQVAKYIGEDVQILLNKKIVEENEDQALDNGEPIKPFIEQSIVMMLMEYSSDLHLDFIDDLFLEYVTYEGNSDYYIFNRKSIVMKLATRNSLSVFVELNTENNDIFMMNQDELNQVTLTKIPMSINDTIINLFYNENIENKVKLYFQGLTHLYTLYLDLPTPNFAIYELISIISSGHFNELEDFNKQLEFSFNSEAEPLTDKQYYMCPSGLKGAIDVWVTDVDENGYYRNKSLARYSTPEDYAILGMIIFLVRNKLDIYNLESYKEYLTYTGANPVFFTDYYFNKLKYECLSHLNFSKNKDNLNISDVYGFNLDIPHINCNSVESRKLITDILVED